MSKNDTSDSMPAASVCPTCEGQGSLPLEGTHWRVDCKDCCGYGKQNAPAWGYQALFDHMYEEHGLLLLESEMEEIVRIVEGMTHIGKDGDE